MLSGTATLIHSVSGLFVNTMVRVDQHMMRVATKRGLRQLEVHFVKVDIFPEFFIKGSLYMYLYLYLRISLRLT